MVSAVRALALYLLALSNNNSNNNNRNRKNAPKKQRKNSEKSSDDAAPPQRGRSRYSPRSAAQNNRDNKSKVSSSPASNRAEVEITPPPLTTPQGPRPTYFSCRHTYETTLMDELRRHYAGDDDTNLELSSPCPGLVRMNDSKLFPQHYDPVYALQSLPHCVVVQGTSIKALAQAALDAVLLEDDDDDKVALQLRQAPKGSLAIHPLVPGMFKGQVKPAGMARAVHVAETAQQILRKSIPAARKGGATNDQPRWLLQLLLLTPDTAVASLVACHHYTLTTSCGTWPNWHLPAGLARVDITETMPSSAYRKLLEALECWRMQPSPESLCVDLGACPGGWTHVLSQKLDCHTIAVDRSSLVPASMQSERVEFVKGDAFTFEPPLRKDGTSQVSWMISDIIAYPDRICELLDTWCRNQWASNMVVTMKFQGQEPSLDDLDRARAIVHGHGYDYFRSKHFFNNKNEVTMMIAKETGGTALDRQALGSDAMYPGLLPDQD